MASGSSGVSSLSDRNSMGDSARGPEPLPESSRYEGREDFGYPDSSPREKTLPWPPGFDLLRQDDLRVEAPDTHDRGPWQFGRGGSLRLSEPGVMLRPGIESGESNTSDPEGPSGRIPKWPNCIARQRN